MAEAIEFDEEQNLGSRGGLMAWLECLFIRVLLSSVTRLPDSFQRGFVRGAAALAALVDRRHGNAARAFMSQALGREVMAQDGEARVRQAYRHLFQISLDTEAFLRRVPKENLLDHYELHTPPGFRELLESGSGGLLITPHVGDWEAGAAAMEAIGMSPAYGVARPPKNRYLARHLLRNRESKGITVMPRRGGLSQSGQALAGGGWIGLLLDQRPSGKHVIAPFFGRPVPCERSAGVLIKRTGVPVVLAACYRTERPFHFEFVVRRILQPDELEGLSVTSIVTLINAEMEALILRRPEQYFWLHDRFRHAPPLEVPEHGPESSEAGGETFPQRRA
ncbi:MAG: lysophospholipid acyltransferase family protein [bacterium]|jgi:KDO2-lipid IV(A) lauroyltransferase